MENMKVEDGIRGGRLAEVTHEGFMRDVVDRDICLSRAGDNCVKRFVLARDEKGNIFIGATRRESGEEWNIQNDFEYIPDYKTFFSNEKKAEKITRAYMFSRENPDSVLLNGDDWRVAFPHIKELSAEEQEKFLQEVC